MADVSRVDPISISPSETMTDNAYKKHMIQTITMGVRVGETVNVALGGIQSFGWSQDRPVTELYQIEPIPDGTFTSAASIDSNSGLLSTKYWPGEVVELVPGKQGPAQLDISRTVFYGSNILSALMYIENAGTEESGAFATSEASSFDPSNSTDSQNFSQYVTLIQQVRPVFIKQIFINPIDGSLAYGRVFEDVWITSMSEETVDAESNKPLIESIKASATRIRPIINNVTPKKE